MTHFLISNIQTFGYLGILIAMVLESACIPLPSEVIMPFGGYLVAIGHLNFWGVVAAGVVGNILGSLIAYLVGYLGGRPLILHYGRWIRLSERHLTQAEDWFAKRGTIAVLIGRVLPIVRTFISLPAGTAKMPVWKFVIYTAMGSVPWVYVLTWSGADLASSWSHVDRFVHLFTYLVAAAIVLILASYIAQRLRKQAGSDSKQD